MLGELLAEGVSLPPPPPPAELVVGTVERSLGAEEEGKLEGSASSLALDN